MGGGGTGIGFIDNTFDAIGGAWGDISGRNAQRDALRAQQNAANQAMAMQKYMFDQQRADYEPWRQAGIGALAGLQDPNFGKNLEMDPGYQFRMSEGMKALEGASAARGMRNSGAAQKALLEYGQNFASDEYNRAYNRQFDRLSTLAGFGGSATQGSANAAGSYGQNMADIYTGLGNAQAGAAMGRWNTLMGLAGQGAQAAGYAYGMKR